MSEWIGKLSELTSKLTRTIKAPKYFILGLALLFTAIVLLPILKILAIISAAILIFIGFNPDHKVSRQILSFIK